jgi:UDP-glucuronate 4-epimerase
MKVFVTGRTGFIATNIINRYTSDGHVVASSSRGDDVIQKLTDFNPDIIFHLAMEGLDPDKMVESNIGLTHRILEYCRHTPVQKLVIFGSSSEYGCKDHPVTEKDVLEPVTIYEGTKAAASMLARCYAFTYGIPTVVIRPMSVYGPHEKEFKLMTRIFSNKLQKLNHAVHDWIYIDDFVEAVVAVGNHTGTDLFDIVNIGFGEQRTNHEVVAIAEGLLGHTLVFTESNVQLGHGTDSQMWVCDPTHLKTRYGFTPSITLEEGMRRHYEWFMKSLITPHT